MVALVGRNEGGKTLSRDAVVAIASRIANCFRTDSYGSEVPTKAVLSHLSRLVTMTISDANKTLSMSMTSNNRLMPG